ncbi:phage tail protein [Alkalicoccobacillus porphyridii]|uniref:Phage tail protein n=1 Tax=Alkalicoccobacillus porphyridii TaxID=2597270 RepID=A0A554A0J1_9BACI|nr:phage tail protein [Alkalicoccobacillus porphyridii]
MSLSPKTSTAEAGTSGSRKLTATVSPEDATNQDVSFTIEPETDGLAVNETGNITWTEDVPAGSYETTVTAGDQSDSHVLTLTETE